MSLYITALWFRTYHSLLFRPPPKERELPYVLSPISSSTMVRQWHHTHYCTRYCTVMVPCCIVQYVSFQSHPRSEMILEVRPLILFVEDLWLWLGTMWRKNELFKPFLTTNALRVYGKSPNKFAWGKLGATILPVGAEIMNDVSSSFQPGCWRLERTFNGFWSDDSDCEPPSHWVVETKISPTYHVIKARMQDWVSRRRCVS